MHNVSILMSYKDLAERSTFAVGTLRNMVHRNEFKKGVHYIKSSKAKSGKVVFFESAFLYLLERGDNHE